MPGEKLAKNLIGHIQGSLTIVRRASELSTKRGIALWVARCACGREQVVRSDRFRQGYYWGRCACETGLTAKPPVGIEIGKLYGEFHVTRHERDDVYVVKCPRGHHESKRAQTILSGANRKDGRGLKCKTCTWYEAQPKLEGQVFGKLRVVELVPREVENHSSWKCVCVDCGQESILRTKRLLAGKANGSHCAGCRQVRQEAAQPLTESLFKQLQRAARFKAYRFAGGEWLSQNSDELISRLVQEYNDGVNPPPKVIDKPFGYFCHRAEFMIRTMLEEERRHRTRFVDPTLADDDGEDPVTAFWESVAQPLGDSSGEDLLDVAFALLPEQDAEFVDWFLSPKAGIQKSALDRARFASIIERLKKRYREIVALCTEPQKGETENARATS